MERGVGMASSNPLGGSNFRKSLPIGIKFVSPSHNGFKLRLRICPYADEARGGIIGV
jgi:hypothetical protein